MPCLAQAAVQARGHPEGVVVALVARSEQLGSLPRDASGLRAGSNQHPIHSGTPAVELGSGTRRRAHYRGKSVSAVAGSWAGYA